MSRILRRPMFRGGGKISSYGTGITSGLADGGMPAKRGLVNGPGGYAGVVPAWAQNANNRGYTLGSEIYNKNVKPVTDLETFLNSFKGGNYAGRNMSDLLIQQEVGSEGDTANLSLAETDIDNRTDLQKLIEKDYKSDQGIRDQKLEAGPIDLKEIELNNSNAKILNSQNTTDDAELSLDEIKNALGSKKAFGRDVSDMLLGFAGAEGDTVTDKFKSFAATEAKKGPSRTEQIDQAAATFMLKDKFQTKRDKAKVDLMMADTLFKIKAGKVISVQEGVLLATKGSNFSDKKLGAGIQNATSDVTGEKYKYKGTTTKEGLKAALNSGELKAGDTVIVKETIKVEGQPDKTIKKIIEIQLIDGKLQVKEIYQV